MESTVIFRDRRDAGQKLLKEIQGKGFESPIVVALPRGGVEVAAEIARGLKAPLDILLVRKLGAPFKRELGIGAMVEGEPPHVVLNQEMVDVLKVNETYLVEEKSVQRQEIERQHKLYRGGRARSEFRDRAIILVDDGVATGASVMAAIEGLKVQKPKSILLAIPVCPPDTAAALSQLVDKAIFLLKPFDFQAVGQFYRDFRQLTDQEVIDMLKR